MAILGEIRKQTWLLIVVIGIAMIAFLAGDLFSENSVVKRMFTGDPNEVGSVNGESISMAEFINLQNQFGSNPNMSQNQTYQQVWNSLVSQKIIQAHAEKVGLEVNDDEVWAYLAKNYGMANAEELRTKVGQLKTQAQQGLSNAGELYQNFLGTFENAKPALLNQKYMDLISMGVATTKKEAEFQQTSNFQNATIDYAFASYESLKKKYKVEITDSEIEAYVKKYPKKYHREASVNLSYVYFPAKPSQQDEKEALDGIKKYLTQSISIDKVNKITDTIPSFASVTDDSAYVTKYSDVPFMGQFVTRSEISNFSAQLPEDFKNFLNTASVGQVGGPFKSGNSYQLVKVAKSKEIADSINSSHILISYQGTDVASQNPNITRTREQAKTLADSILNTAKSNPSTFKELVTKYSDDAGSKEKDGNIGWTSRNSRNIAPEYLQFLTTYKNGEIGLTESNFGFHIIKIDGVKNQTGYQIANIVKEVKPSQITSDKNFADARNFAQAVQGKSLNEFANLAQKKNFNYNTAEEVTRFNPSPLVDPNTGFSQEKDNDILKWAFSKNTKPGDTFLFTTSNEDQIIVHLTSRSSEGLASAKAARISVEPILINQKLAKMVNDKYNGKPSLDGFVKDFGAEKGATSTTFGSAQIAGKGAEPLVAGAAFGLKEGQTSAAIPGQAGVYVVTLKKLDAPTKIEDVSFLQDQLTQTQTQKLTQQLMSSLIEAAEIVDNRTKRLDVQQ